MVPIWHFVNGMPQIGAPVNLGPVSITSSAVTSSVSYAGPAGSAATPAFGIAVNGVGVFSSGANLLNLATNGNTDTHEFATYHWLKSDSAYIAFGAAADVSLSRGAADVLTTPDRFVSTGPLAGIGYATGAGGTVTQGTSKSTAVSLNTVTGEITMHNATLNAATVVSFTLNSTAIAAGDYVHVQHVSAGTIGAYTCSAVAGANTATISVRNATAGNLGEAIVLKYVVFKAVTA